MDAVKRSYRDNFHPQMRRSHTNDWLYDYVAGLKHIQTVFEFGCGAGRHLLRLRRHYSHVYGIDVNATAVFHARFINGLDAVKVGDERSLKDIPDDAFDLVFTNSVLCHMEHPPFADLQRIAKRHLIMVEAEASYGPRWFRHDYPGERVFRTTSGQGYNYCAYHYAE